MNESARGNFVPRHHDAGSTRGRLYAKRILNNNAVMVVDDAEAVSIVLGKSIGYGVRPGDLVDASRISETFLPDAVSRSNSSRRSWPTRPSRSCGSPVRSSTRPLSTWTSA